MLKKILARYFVTLAKGYADHCIFNRTLSLSNRAITLDPAYAEAYMLRGWARCAISDQVEEGKADLDMAARLKPNSNEILLRRAAVDGNLGYYIQAIEATNQILATDPDNVEAIVTRGIAYRRSKQNDLALQDFNRALELEPRNASLMQILALAYEARGDYGRAMTFLNASLSINSSHVHAYFYRAVLHQKHGDIEQAQADYRKVIKLDKNFATDLFNVTIARSKQDPENALKTYNDLLIICEDPALKSKINEQLQLLTQQA